jgi:cephalosporin hydroxylase
VDAKQNTASLDAEEIVRSFHELYYTSADRTIRVTYWLGVRTIKCPLDLWIYQEIIHQTRPDLIVETGSGAGGSAYFMASICDLVGSGRIVTIDVRDRQRPEHPRITYINGSSVADEVVAAVNEEARGEERVMVILDSDHARDHVLSELRLYAPLVTPGNYLIVEDTNVNGHPVFPEHGPGPAEALEAFLAEDDGFEVDRSREKFFLTMNPGGYLRRVGGSA